MTAGRARELAGLAFWHAHPGRPERPYHLLRESQWWAPDALRALQLEALGPLLAAAASAPFYRERFRAVGLEPGDVRSLDDLRVLQPLERADLQREGIAGLRAPGGRGSPVRTSGSVGRPVEVIRSGEMKAWIEAAERRGREWHGYRLGQHRLLVVHTGPSARPSAAAARARVHAAALALANVTVFATDRLADRGTARRVAARLERRPAVLANGVSNSLYLLSLALLEEGLRLRLRACVSSAAGLPEHYRPALEEAFSCSVYQRYAAWEAGAIAHECPEGRGLHVAAENVVLEIVGPDGDPARPGETGEILVTVLRNRALPLLRYRLGDLAVAASGEACPCGRGLPLLGRLLGRSNDLLVTASGRLVPPEVVSNLMRQKVVHVLDFQVEQREDLGVDVKVVLRDGPGSEACPARIGAELDRLVELPGGTTVERVDRIPVTMGGKLRHIRSRAARPSEPPAHAAGPR